MKLQFKNQKSDGTDPSCVTWLMGAGPSEGASAGAFWREAICFGELFVRRERSAGGVGTRRCGSAGRLALPREMRWWPAGGCKTRCGKGALALAARPRRPCHIMHSRFRNCFIRTSRKTFLAFANGSLGVLEV